MTNKYDCFREYQEFFKREVCPIISYEDRKQFISFYEKNECFIFKPLNAHSGHGIQIIETSNTDVNQLFNKLFKTSGIVEQLIVQGEELNRINPSSVNTCRIITFQLKNRTEIIGATLRMGVGEAKVDNAGSGGIYAAIDLNTGILCTDAMNYNNDHFLYHPTTGEKILGFQIPEWNAAKEIISKMATHREGTVLISWDIAYSNQGWCMVEANDNGDWSLIQSNKGVGLKPYLYKLMDEYFSEQNN